MFFDVFRTGCLVRQLVTVSAPELRAAEASRLRGKPGERSGFDETEKILSHRRRRGLCGSNLCEALLASGFEVICLDNFRTGRIANLDALKREPRFALVEADIIELLARFAAAPTRRRLGLQSRLRRFPTALPIGPRAHLAHERPGDTKSSRLRGAGSSTFPSGLDERDLWRSANASAGRKLLGLRQPNGPPCLLRRRQASCRNSRLRLWKSTTRRGSRGAHLQHVWAENARR